MGLCPPASSLSPALSFRFLPPWSMVPEIGGEPVGFRKEIMTLLDLLQLPSATTNLRQNFRFPGEYQKLCAVAWTEMEFCVAWAPLMQSCPGLRLIGTELS